ncbi:MAG: Crp/Fnr family transcriptional regulator [Chitinophagales bacterium]
MPTLTHPLLSLDQYFSTSIMEWGTLTPEERHSIRSSTETMRVKAHKILFEEGTYPKGIYRIVSGRVKFYKQTGDGLTQLLGICTANEVFGYRALISNQIHSISATTMEPSVLEFIPASAFMNVLSKSSDFANFLLTKLSQDFGIYINRAMLFAQMDVRRRLAVTLLMLNEKFKSPKAVTSTSSIHISRTDLAGFVGSTLETVIRMLKKFVEEGLIKANGKNIVITDLKRMAEVAEIG